MGRLCNQKEIRHQLLTLAGCRVPSRCCFFSFFVGVESITAFFFFFFAFDIIVLVNLLLGLIESPARPRSFANADKQNAHIYIKIIPKKGFNETMEMCY